jgi:DNA ligase D-like protein (predicted ligase)
MSFPSFLGCSAMSKMLGEYTAKVNQGTRRDKIALIVHSFSQLTKAKFVEPMLLLAANALPEGADWVYEAKLDGYRALAIKSDKKVQLRSRNDNDFSLKYPSLVKGLESLADETVLDGEVVALDDLGRPSFNALQNYTPSNPSIFYYVFDVLVLGGRDLLAQPLSVRRDLLRRHVLPTLRDPIRECPELNAALQDVIKAIRAQGLEGVVAKNLNSSYEPGRRSGSWRKMRLNKGQDFVIAGYTIGPKNFDAVIFGHYEGKKLRYVGRTRNGFTPLLREQLQKRFRDLQIQECPFANLPEAKAGRWGLGLTADKMKDCRWLTPQLVGQFEFVEWTADDHLRHSRFIGLRDDIKAQNVRSDTPKDHC